LIRFKGVLNETEFELVILGSGAQQPNSDPTTPGIFFHARRKMDYMVKDYELLFYFLLGVFFIMNYCFSYLLRSLNVQEPSPMTHCGLDIKLG